MRLLSRLTSWRPSVANRQVSQPRCARLGVEPLEARCVPTGMVEIENPALIPAPNTKLDPVWSLQLQQAATPTPGARVAFVGDSILYRFQHLWGAHVWQSQIAPLAAKNISIDGNTTAQVLWSIEQGLLAEVRPDVVVVMIGVNNLYGGEKVEGVVEGVEAMLDSLRETQPQADILLLSILPTFDLSPEFNDRINATNKLLANLDDGEQVHYLDITNHFLTGEGETRRELLVDSVHHNAEGYSVLANAIVPSIQGRLDRATQLANSLPLVGDWDGNGVEGIALVHLASGTWFLRDDYDGRETSAIFQYGLPGWVPVAGDWDDDGDDDIGTFDPYTGTWYLRNDASGGLPDAVFEYGLAYWRPVTGDWDGDGRDSVGVFNPFAGYWFLRNGEHGGAPDEVFLYGWPGWYSITGDWNNDGRDEVGVIDPTSMTWYLDTSHREEHPESFSYGGAGWRVLAGDWDEDGEDTVGVMDSRGTWYLR